MKEEAKVMNGLMDVMKEQLGVMEAQMRVMENLGALTGAFDVLERRCRGMEEDCREMAARLLEKKAGCPQYSQEKYAERFHLMEKVACEL